MFESFSLFITYYTRKVEQAGFAEPHSSSTIGWVGVGLGWGWVGVNKFEKKI